ncbi:hypothetical protein L484_013976 [Morus notabilis]|uniref:Uncharacterized protein n=1 Tax=Morus notabilis TaxID=981085 RepID=W9R4C0_9ROSA|nr:hypothetical protein L484_013976 [Morus notabilis]
MAVSHLTSEVHPHRRRRTSPYDDRFHPSLQIALPHRDSPTISLLIAATVVPSEEIEKAALYDEIYLTHKREIFRAQPASDNNRMWTLWAAAIFAILAQTAQVWVISASFFQNSFSSYDCFY